MTTHDATHPKITEIASLADHYPGVVIILDEQANRVRYMSPTGLRKLGVTVPELTALGPGYYERYFNLEHAHDYVPKVVELLERNDLSYAVTFFQQVRTGAGGTFEWYLSTARILTQDAAGHPELIICFACPIDPETHITPKVRRLLDENNFLRRHHQQFARLTPREREVLRLLALGHSAPEIAGQLFISAQTAETHRRNIRQKLGAESVFELGEFARAFDLI
ncbi:LuxR family transcriptional regulator [Hymenobacter gummosus]|uniref:LuxR family transcriptional regulator n=1 Tax=Hymenobacter gummosus TaxID=1776032 RepID=A0A431TZY0_9BACT|nr:helix-turn-helix transcriptional regulator [Hymenobacter gummosus]RTQ47918.1 LuxR family transcriptional regulator [Hymenobacter gummosus]